MDLKLTHGYHFPSILLTKQDSSKLFQSSLHLQVSHIPTLSSALLQLEYILTQDYPIECILSFKNILNGTISILNGIDQSNDLIYFLGLLDA